MNLLLIEDSCPIAERLAELFSSHMEISEFMSVTASEFNKGITDNFFPDIVLLGVTHPLANSFKLLTRITHELRPGALIMLDNGTDQYTQLHFLKHGATDVVDIYNNLDELLHIIKSYRKVGKS